MKKICFLLMAASLFISCSSPKTDNAMQLTSEEPIRAARDKAYEGKRVSFTGYLAMPSQEDWAARGDEMMRFRLSNRPCGKGEGAVNILTFEAKWSGMSDNRIEVHSVSDEEDVFVRTSDSKELRCNHKMRVTGTVRYLSAMPVTGTQTDTLAKDKSDPFRLEDVKLDVAE